MKISHEYPPNISLIRSVVGERPEMVYCYGDTIFNPAGKEIPIDVYRHEQVHEQQQKEFISPELWWLKYLGDNDFRLSQELEAYSVQYRFIKNILPAKGQKEALFEFASNLSKLYQLPISYQKAENLIRQREKKL